MVSRKQYILPTYQSPIGYAPVPHPLIFVAFSVAVSPLTNISLSSRAQSDCVLLRWPNVKSPIFALVFVIITNTNRTWPILLILGALFQPFNLNHESKKSLLIVHRHNLLIIINWHAISYVSTYDAFTLLFISRPILELSSPHPTTDFTRCDEEDDKKPHKEKHNDLVLRPDHGIK